MKYQILQKNGYESKHNMDCWGQCEYIGFGVAAHSYLEKTRYSNLENVEEYINNIKNGNFGKNKIVHEKQEIDDVKKEYMLLNLRKISGVNINRYKEKFGENPLFIFCKELEKLTNQGLIEVNDDNIKLTKKGLDFANLVWEEFV